MSSATELAAWQAGTPTGGPNSDGRYPLTFSGGVVHLVYCPAAQALNPALAEQPIETFANTASAAATTATTEAATATTAKLAAQTSAANALASETAALASKNAAATSATNAATSATNAATSATNASNSAALADADRIAAETAATTATNAATAATNASNITSGTLAVARLGSSGTRDGSSFLLGSNVWGNSLSNNLNLTATVGATRSIELGTNRSDDFSSWIDFGGDSTYTDYGLRIQRNAGANGGVLINSRGTGTLSIRTQEAGPIEFRTTNLQRMVIDANGVITLANGAYVANGWAMDGLATAARRMQWKASGVMRMDFGMDGGDSIIMNAFDDAGASLGKVFSVSRASRIMDFAVTPTVASVAMALVGHVHSGADITSGTVADARLPTTMAGKTFSSKLIATDATDVRMDLPGRNGSGMANLQLNYSSAGNVGFYDNVAAAWRFRVDVNGLVSVTHIPDLATSKITGLDAALTGKQAASANLTAWSALATSAKANASHTHLPADITQDASNRFVTDAEKTAWNGKLDKTGGALTGAVTIPGDGNPSADTAAVRLSGSYGGGLSMLDGTFSAKIYTSVVGSDKRINLWGTTTGVIAYFKDTTSYDALTINGGLQSLGGTAQLGFADRSGGAGWVWYSDGNSARLWNGTDRVLISADGSMTAPTFIPSSAAGAYIGGNGSGMQLNGLTYFNGQTQHLAQNGAAWIRDPRIFIGGSDPGAQASDGDIWIP